MAHRNSTFRSTLFGLILMGCAVQQEDASPFDGAGNAAGAGGDRTATGGTATGGVASSSGGLATGGASSGGSSTGGMSSGGTPTGGTSSGGATSGGSSSGGTTASGGTGGTSNVGCNGVDAWHAGTYAEGDVVESTCTGANATPCPQGETHSFRCKPWPYTGWCGQRQPGVGQAWSDAWDDLGRCTSSGTGGAASGGTSSGGTSSGGTSSGGTSSGGTSSGGTSSGGTSSGGTSSGGTGGTSNGASLCGVLTSALFDQIFPAKNRTSVYTYTGLLQAAAAFPTFASSGDATTCKRELAAFFANVAWESGELHYAEQIAKAAYCSSQSGCACDPTDTSHWYYGRGALQLSWNYNYCAAGSALGVDLHGDPGRIATDPVLVWETGIWFWMTNEGAGSQTCHAAMSGGGGFGETIRTINGGQECNLGGYNGSDAVRGRVDYFVAYCALLGVDPGGSVTDLDC